MEKKCVRCGFEDDSERSQEGGEALSDALSVPLQTITRKKGRGIQGGQRGSAGKPSSLGFHMNANKRWKEGHVMKGVTKE